MTRYTVDHTGDSFEARRPQDAWRILATELRVSGPRRLTAYGGPYEVTASLYDGEDRIVNVDTQRLLRLP